MADPLAYAGRWSDATEPELVAFRDWAERYVNAATPAGRAALVSEGVELARQRRPLVRALIERDAERALAQTVPAAVRQVLPPAVLAELEERIAGTGSFRVWCALAPRGSDRASEIHRSVRLDDRVFTAHVYGRRLGQQTDHLVSLHGIALDGHLALHESPLRALEPGEFVMAPAEVRDPLTFASAPAGAVAPGDGCLFEAQGTVWQVEELAERQLTEARLIEAERSPGPHAASYLLTDPVPLEEPRQAISASWTTGTKRILVVRVDFSDNSGGPMDRAEAQTWLDNVAKPHYLQSSYGKLQLACTVTEKVYRMPKTAEYYAVNGALDELEDHGEAAAAADHTLANYDVVTIAMNYLLPSNRADNKFRWAGFAQIGGNRMFTQGGYNGLVFSFVHELGHLLGLLHAQLWKTTDGNPVSPSGTAEEYGDAFDEMGSGRLGHFNPWYKDLLRWLPAGAVRQVTQSGTYRVHAFDHEGALATTPIALQFFRDGVRDYWVAFRPNFPESNSPVRSGAYVYWGGSGEQINSRLLALGPTYSPTVDYQAGLLPAALPVGQTFEDSAHGIKITPIARGGSGAAQYLDVQVTMPAALPSLVTHWGNQFTQVRDIPLGLTNVVAIAGGSSRAMALKADGTVVTWGFRSQATPQSVRNAVAIACAKGSEIHGAVLSDGSVVLWGNDAASVSAPGGLTGVREIAIGLNHVVARKADGTVTAWGNSATNVPAGLQDVVEVAAGSAFSLARKTDGTVVGWGTSIVAQVPGGLAGVRDIAAGGAHALALKADGTVVAWGSNTQGQTDVPPGLTGVVAVGAGELHSLAIREDGSVVAWGYNQFGQAESPRLAPVIAVDGGSLESIALTGLRPGQVSPAIATQPQAAAALGGSGATFSVTATGSPAPTYRWQRKAVGSSFFVDLSDDATYAGTGSAELRVSNLTAAMHGDQFRCVIGSVVGSVETNAATLSVNFAPTIASQPKPTIVGAGLDATFSLTANGNPAPTYRWQRRRSGSATFEDIADDTTFGGATTSRLTVRAVTKAMDGDQFRCVAANSVGSTASDGVTLVVEAAPTIATQPVSQVISAGANATFSIVAAGDPQPTLKWQRRAAGTRDFVDLSANSTYGGVTTATLTVTGPTAAMRGDQFRCVATSAAGTATSIPASLDFSRSVVVWGFSAEGTTTIPGNLTDVVAIAAGSGTCLALKGDGSVVAWGSEAGSLPAGLGGVRAITTANSRYRYIWGAVKSDGSIVIWGREASLLGTVPSLAGISQLSIGGNHALALGADGTVTAFGGSFSSTEKTVPAGLKDVAAVAAGNAFSLALKSDGSVVAWGPASAATLPAGLSGVIAIAAGTFHGLALKADGTVVAWGENNQGQTAVPSGLNGVVAIAAGAERSMALKSDGTVVVWGSGGANPFNQSAVLAGQGPVAAIAGHDNHCIALAGSPFPAVAETPVRSLVSNNTAALTVTAPGATVQWVRNGATVGGATAATLVLSNVQPADTGLYQARMTAGQLTLPSAATVVGLTTTSKSVGSGTEVLRDVRHPNGNIYDQILLEGQALSFTADGRQVTRLSFIDLQDDILQVEMSGAGTLSLVLDSPTGPAVPVNYNQSVNYMKGHAGIVISGANETTNVTVTSVGRLTAFDPTGQWDLTKPISSTNDPANNGNPIFRSGVAYDGLADLAYIAITSTNGKFGGIRAAGASFSAIRGLTGIYAPGVTFTGPLFVGDISAFDDATPVILTGSVADSRITGGDLQQGNGAAVRVSGLTQLRFTDGRNSHGTLLRARNNKATLLANDTDVTTSIVVNP